MKDTEEAINYLVIKFAELEDAIHHLMAEVRKNNPPPFKQSYEKSTGEKIPESLSHSQQVARQMLKTKTQISGEFCTCGGLLVQTGTCKTCQSCGNNAGCG